MSITGVESPTVRFKHHLQPVIVPDEGIYLFSDNGTESAQGGGVDVVAALLDGSRSLAAVLAAASATMPLAQARHTLRDLVGRGWLCAYDSASLAETTPGELAYWDQAGLDADEAVASLGTAIVGLVALGGVDPRPVERALRDCGVAVTVSDQPADDELVANLTVVLTADYLDPMLSVIDSRQRAGRQPWLLARPDSAQLWLGPWLQPDNGPCWHCLAHRLWGHRQAETFVQTRLRQPGVPVSRPTTGRSSTRNLAAHLIATEVTNWLSGVEASHQGVINVLSTLDLSIARHQVDRRPECSSCGDAGEYAARVQKSFRLEHRDVLSRDDGGYRSESAERTRDRYQHLVSPVSGVISHLRRDDRGPGFFNSYRSGGNVAAGASSLGQLRAGLRNENGGKGVTPIQAEVGAICEALERHSGQFRGDEPRCRTSFNALVATDSMAAIHPDTCQLFDGRQFAGRLAWNARHSSFQHIPQAFDADEVIDWTPLWSLTQSRHRHLPTGMLYYGAPGPASIRADSNGCAAGSSREDAVLQGMLELVERDAIALWWYNRTPVPAVDMESFADGWTRELLRVYAGINREVWVLDITSDLGIPVFAAVSRRVDKPSEDIVFGFGAHLDPEIALRRALTELNQMMPQLVGVDGEKGYGCEDLDAVDWWRNATVATEPYLVGNPDRPTRRRSDTAAADPDLIAAVTDVRHRIEATGLEVLVLDQTRADIGLPVVRVVVPGLRSMWSRFAPGRLFDVPVQLGRRAVPVDYRDLNPRPMFL